MARPSLFTHRKFAELSARLGSRPLAAGHLELIWHAAYGTGDPIVGTAASVEVLPDWRGPPGVLADALVASGFLESTDAGLRIHDFWDHTPQYVRKRRTREDERKNRLDRSVTAQRPVSDRPLDSTPSPSPSPSPKKKREEENPTPTPPPRGRVASRKKKPLWRGEIPERLRGDERFPALWTRWVAFRGDELRKPVTQISGDQALQELSLLGPERACRAIEHTIANGWQGIREPELPRNGYSGNVSTYSPDEKRTLKRLGVRIDGRKP